MFAGMCVINLPGIKMNSHSKFPHAMEVDLITQQTLYAKIYGHNVSTGIY